VIVILFAGLWIGHKTKWEKYYEKSLLLSPNKLLVENISEFNRLANKSALDLGCGAGNETAFLLKNDWRVLAIDSEPLAIKVLRSRVDVQKHLANLTTDIKKFEYINWNNIPHIDLAVASYSLPFCSPKNFPETWDHLVDKINKDGFFVGEFFGTDYSGFSAREQKNMTFLSKDQVLDLFQGFKIEFFKEIKEKSKSRTGRAINAHIFEIIARKK
jgi:SAM-dependent methyltransferase